MAHTGVRTRRHGGEPPSQRQFSARMTAHAPALPSPATGSTSTADSPGGRKAHPSWRPDRRHRMAEPSDSSAAPQALRDLSGIVLGDHSFQAVLQRASEIAKRAISGADEVSVTMRTATPPPSPPAVRSPPRSTSRSTRPTPDRACRPSARAKWSSSPTWRPRHDGRITSHARSPPAVALPVRRLAVDGVYVGALNSHYRTPELLRTARPSSSVRTWRRTPRSR
jgi:hypothetical protein